MNYRGFTIVELLIVIVVIAILAAVSVVAYGGVQQRARDSERRAELNSLKNVLHLYQADRGDYADAGCGNGTGSGWLAADYDGTGPNQSIDTCLISGNYLSRAIIDPSGLGSCSGIDCHAYMKANCSGVVYLYANLETVGHTSTDTDSTCYTAWDTQYGMNYVLRVN